MGGGAGRIGPTSVVPREERRPQPVLPPRVVNPFKDTLYSAGVSVAGWAGSTLFTVLQFLFIHSIKLFAQLQKPKPEQPQFDIDLTKSLEEQFEENGFAFANRILDLVSTDPEKGETVLNAIAERWKKDENRHLKIDTPEGMQKCKDFGDKYYHHVMEDEKFKEYKTKIINTPEIFAWPPAGSTQEVKDRYNEAMKLADSAKKRIEPWDGFISKWIIVLFKDKPINAYLKIPFNKDEPVPNFGKLLEKIIKLNKFCWLKNIAQFRWLTEYLIKDVLPPVIADLETEKGEDFAQLKVLLEKLQKILLNEKKAEKLHLMVCGMIEIYEGNFGASAKI